MTITNKFNLGNKSKKIITKKFNKTHDEWPKQ